MTDLEKDKILLLAHSVGKMARELQSIKRLLKEIADTPQTEQGKCPFDDPIPCEWVNCPNSKTDCPWK